QDFPALTLGKAFRVIPPEFKPFDQSLKKAHPAVRAVGNLLPALVQVSPHIGKPPTPFTERKSHLHIWHSLIVATFALLLVGTQSDVEDRRRLLCQIRGKRLDLENTSAPSLSPVRECFPLLDQAAQAARIHYRADRPNGRCQHADMLEPCWRLVPGRR